jgi:glutathione S-transferase
MLTRLQLQPPIIPRPDLARLGIKYRRIPILSIGRDVYLDTRLIIQKLEQLYPSIPKLGASSAEDKALERLLEHLVVDGGVFSSAMRLIPADLPLLKDPKFQRDRADFTGQKLTRETAAALRPEAVNEIRATMAMLETTLLADGREWILKSDKPTLADIEAVWPLHWLSSMPGALPADQVSATQFPKVYAWIQRFQTAVSAAKAAQPKPTTVSGEQAEEIITKAQFNEDGGQVDATDGLVTFHGLAQGKKVALWPTDTGANHRDVGKLVSITATEFVIEPEAEGGKVRLHAPRHGFRLRPADGPTANL